MKSSLLKTANSDDILGHSLQGNCRSIYAFNLIVFDFNTCIFKIFFIYYHMLASFQKVNVNVKDRYKSRT